MSEANQVLSIWKDGHNIGVVSATDTKFIEKFLEWAKKNGYKVKRGEQSC